MNAENLNFRTKFEINPEYDIEGYKDIIKNTPEDIKPSNLLNTDSEVVDFVNTYFSSNISNISKRVLEIEKEWKLIESDFVRLSLSVFNSRDIPDEIYSCYPTSCPLIARSPILHRVAFPLDSNNSLACYVIAHELLHEFFYHHIYNLYGDSIDLNRRDIWDIAEIVNVFIMSKPEWQALFKLSAEPYPIHKELLLELKPTWEKSIDIDEFIKSCKLFPV